MPDDLDLNALRVAARRAGVAVRGARGPAPVRRTEAARFLRLLLSGKTVPVSDIFLLGRAQNLSESTLRRAKKHLAVEACEVNGRAAWRLPPVDFPKT